MVNYINIEKQTKEFSLQISMEFQGGITGILGESGCGKTTLLHCISGLTSPDKGEIRLGNQVLFHQEQGICLSPQERKVGYLLQQYGLFPNMTGWEQILWVAQDRENLPELQHMLEQLGIWKDRHKYPKELSGGQQQRFALGRVLATKPNILLLDEPFTALDSHRKQELTYYLKKVLDDVSKPTFLVSHNFEEMDNFCENVMLLKQGKVDVFGKKQEIFSVPRSYETAKFMGVENFSSFRMEKEVCSLLDWGVQFPCKEKGNKTGKVGIWAEKISLLSKNQESLSVPCEIIRIQQKLRNTELVLKPINGQGTLVVKQNGDRENQGLSVGGKQVAFFHIQDLLFF